MKTRQKKPIPAVGRASKITNGLTGGSESESSEDAAPVAVNCAGQFEAVDTKTSVKIFPEARSWLDVAPTADNSDVFIGPGRWLCRGAGCLLIAASGAGKSTWTATAAFSFALGRQCLGFVPSRPLKSLIIQAEDDDGDLADMRDGIMGHINPTGAEVVTIRENVLIVTERVTTGTKFLNDVVRPLLDLHRPDLLWVNPLSAYFGDDLNNQQAVAEFFRNNLNQILAVAACVGFIVHHIPKPTKDRKNWTGTELSYTGAGSADLSNWAREVIFLREVRPGLFDMTCCKRGRRLDWRDDQQQRTNSRLIAHAQYPDQFWRDATGSVLAELGVVAYSDANLLALVPNGGIDQADLVESVAETFSVAARTARRYVNHCLRVRTRRTPEGRIQLSLLSSEKRPRKEVYPESPNGRPVVWITRA